MKTCFGKARALAMAGAVLAAAQSAMAGEAVRPDVGIFTDGEFFVGCNYWARHAGMYMWSDWNPGVVEREFAPNEAALFEVK